MATYATLDDLRTWTGSAETFDSATHVDSLEAATKKIDDYVARGRRCFIDSGSASAKVFAPTSGDPTRLEVPFFSTTTGLVVKVDLDNDGVYETTLSSSSYVADIESEGWAYSLILRVDGGWFPSWPNRRSVQVTARWGWDEVPSDVKRACLILASELQDRARTRFGVVSGEFGAMRLSSDPMKGVAGLIGAYRRMGIA